MSTPKVCKKCKRVIGWYNQTFTGDVINKEEVPHWDCPVCECDDRSITKLMGGK